MSLRFDPHEARLVSAGEYLLRFRRRGRPLRLEHLGLEFYGVADCLCLGREAQALLPVQGEDLPFIFRESCHYPANEARLPHIAREALEGAALLEVDEAAPFYPPAAFNLWHWSAESLPKLLALESAGYTGCYVVDRESPVVRDSLALFGIGPQRLLEARAAYRVKRLFIPQRLSGFDLPGCMPLTAFTRDKLLAAVGVLPGGKRCYVRRVGRRKPLNEAELLALLREFDFEVMLPESLTLPEQWRCMTNVECSVMAHGANSALCLLQKPRSGMVELFGNRYISYNNLHAVRLLRLDYRALVQDLDLSDAPAGMSLEEFLRGGLRADVLVDIVHLRILLENMLR